MTAAVTTVGGTQRGYSAQVSTEPVHRGAVERHNNLVVGAVLLAIVLSFVPADPAVVVEAAARAAVVALVGYGLVRWRRDYFSHWTSWLAVVLTVASAFRLAQVLA